MEGVSWIDRQPSDWLASNGRWYPARNYPNGWNASALPPAPGHGGANSILEKYANVAANAVGLNPTASTAKAHESAPQRPPTSTSTSTPTSTSTRGPSNSETTAPPPKPPPSAPSAPGFSVARSGRSVADATVTSQRTYANTVGAGAPPPPAIASPAPPGRVRSDAPMAPARQAEVTSPPPPAQPPAKRAIPPEPKSEFEVIAGDLGSVLGSAKKRIEKALNDSFEG